MSGHTEFQRALNRYRLYRNRILQLLRHYLLPWFRLRVIKGVMIGAHHGPLKGARVTLNGWRSIKTDSKGRFTFYFILRKVNFLTVEWREAELINWIRIDLTRQRVSKLKLKWPLLVRGELVNEQGQPLVQVPVALNQIQVTKTDAHGAFIFPVDSDSKDQFDQLSFQLLGHSFVHHFKANPQAHLLHRFMYTEGKGLFHLEDRPAAQVQAKQIYSFNERLRWGLRLSFALITMFLIINFFMTQQRQDELDKLMIYQEQAVDGLVKSHHSLSNMSPPSINETTKWRHAGLLERKKDSLQENQIAQGLHLKDQALKREPDQKNSRRPSIFDGLSGKKHTSKPSVNDAKNTMIDPEAFEEFDIPKCQSMEFVYRNYYVPRGMEGILLSLVFGHWQSWRNDLSLFNGLNRHDQLQAGQRVKLKLPLHTWSIYKHVDESSWQKLLKQTGCLHAKNLCRKLIQAWNPHVYLRRLKKRDQLLINFSLLKRRPYGGATLSRIESLRRGSVPKRRKPRLQMPKNCKLLNSLTADLL